MTSSASSKLNDDALDPEQQAAVTAAERAIAVLAGPGSGKTRALCYRARHLLTKDAQACALLLTFTNKAAAEMKARALGVTKLPSKRIQASTFHTFCADVLRAHGDLIGVSKDFEILDQEESDEIAKDAARHARMANLSQSWREFRLRRQAIPDGLKAFGAAYQERKRAACAVDFDDLVVHVADLFEQRPEVARAYGAKYRHILVDEFQDTNAVQFAVVNALAPHAATVSIFADDDQAIFGFAGAEAENIERFIRRLGAREFPLTVNYRSGAEIVKVANTLIAAAPSSSGRRMRAHKSGGAVRFLCFPGVEHEAKDIAAEIAGVVSGGTATWDIAVLVRAGYRADSVLRQLRARGLPVSDWRGVTHVPADRRTLAACLAVARGTLNTRQVQRLSGLMGVAVVPERGTDAFLKAHAGRPLAQGLSVVRTLAFEGASPHTIAKAAQAAVAAQDPEMGAGLAEIVDAVSHFELYDREFTLEHLLAELALGSVGRAPAEGGGIKVASLHRTKGLQWKSVYLLGLEERHLPHKSASDPKVLSEERRLCFVGVSRAQQQLTITYSRTSGGYPRTPSRFVAEMGFTV